MRPAPRRADPCARGAPAREPAARRGGDPAPARPRPVYSALSVTALVQAPDGSLVITGSDPAERSVFTVRS